MNVEYTGRQYEITSAIRKEVETGLAKIRKILGDKFDSKVILAVEKHRHKAEITINPRNGPLVGLAQAGDMISAVNEAFEHLETQAIKYKTPIPVVVHKFPQIAKTTDVHLVRSDEAVAIRPMTLEEAIKEAHFRDRDVFVFRDKKGKVMILHRTRDGKMELIEAP